MIIWTDTVKCYLYGPTKTHIIIVNEACTSHDVRSTIAFQRILTLRYFCFMRVHFNQFFQIVLYIFLLKDFYFLF